MIDFKWYSFSALSTEELYHILALRAKIFVVEQHCVYLDPDGKDLFALHLLGTKENQLVAYLRLFPPSETAHHVSFGRLVTDNAARSRGYGRRIMQTMLEYCDIHFPLHRIECSAQYYLKTFYESFGFKAEGRIYDEDGIPHIYMKK